MAMPAVAKVAAKIAASLASNEKGRKVLGGIIIAVLSPLILSIAVICVLLGGGKSHNIAALDFAFYGGVIPENAPKEYKKYLEEMRAVFTVLDRLIGKNNERLTEGSLNPERIKALFYAVHFGRETLIFNDGYLDDFIGCFIYGVEIEPVNEDDTGETRHYPLKDPRAIYANVHVLLDRPLTTEERANAERIYNVLLYGDNIPDDTYSFDGYWNGGVEYLGSGTDTKVVYFNQADSRWGHEPYGKSGTIASSGCGPAALAMVVSTLTGNTINPSAMAKWSYENGYRAEGQGSYHSLIPDGARHFGLKAEGAGSHEGQKIIDALEAGRLVIAIMSKGQFTNGGHFIVLRGITSDGQILVADPASIRRSERKWELSLILKEANQGAGAGGPFWILSP